MNVIYINEQYAGLNEQAADVLVFQAILLYNSKI